MVKITVLTALAGLAIGVVAKDKEVTTQMFLVGFDKQSLVASVITSDATATTFSVACANSKDAGCATEMPTDFTFTQGPSTMHFSYSHKPTAADDPARSVDVGCVITADHGTCSKSLQAILGTITSTAASATTTFTKGGSELGGQAVTITAGNLVTSSTASSTTSSSTSTKSSSSSTSSAAAVSTMTVVPQQDTTTSVPTTSSSTTSDAAFFEATKSISVATSSSKAGGMPMITANAQWVIGGAAAVAALAAL